MASLDRNLRRDLENAVKKARRIAEAGARQSLEQLAVHHHEPWGSLTPDQRKLRNRLRAHGRQLGDKRDEKKGTQGIERLVGECAYEHWHRLLFARFLAENELLVEPDSGMPLSLDECRELAREQNVDWLGLASDFAQRMLPQIFRAGDPVLEVTLPPETRQELESILAAQSGDAFSADDSLGWVYQFWQSDAKEAANKSESKIGAEDLPAVTQLFTEDYMVLHLLHNSLGAWWAAKVLTANPELRNAASEEALRAACALPGIDWEYLRFARGSDGWWPCAGSHRGWPAMAKDISVLDPCMGSGHFLAYALPILVAFRCREEGLSSAAACGRVLQENLFGLELDPRCTQIAAFNLALTAWRLGGFQPLPPLNLACAGLGLNASRDAWVELAGASDKLRRGMEQLYQLFRESPHLGSLINPQAIEGNLLVAEFGELRPLFDRAIAQENGDEVGAELAVTARGVATAAEILSRRFTLVCTNVPYLGRGKQDATLRRYCETTHPDSKADLATCFVERCIDFCEAGGTAALVTPQNWLFLGTYKKLRRRIFRSEELAIVVRLGPNAFRDMNWWAATTALLSVSRTTPGRDHVFAGFDIAPFHAPEEKAHALRRENAAMLSQRGQLENPDARLSMGEGADLPLLSAYADCVQGTTTGDNPRFVLQFWELPDVDGDWEFFQGTVDNTQPFGGRSEILRWEQGNGELARSEAARVQGQALFGKRGVFVGQMRELPVTLYSGEFYNMNGAALVPHKPELLPAIWAYCSSDQYRLAIREIDQALKVTNATLLKVPFDCAHWKEVAERQCPDGLPPPASTDPTQWIFDGHPRRADSPLHVAVLRLLGYRWPRQQGRAFDQCGPIESDGLDAHVDQDGIVPITALRGEAPAAHRIRALLSDAFGSDWSAQCQAELLRRAGAAGGTLASWIEDSFFAQHCEMFGHRPVAWHVWDGMRGGFGALVNYHRLVGGQEGRRTLEKLIYTYLGDWIDRQRSDQKDGVEGADGKLAASEHLKVQLEKILEGEPPYDIFVRWRPLHRQPVGWDPSVSDGVRINIRPFVSARPLNARGKASCILRATPRIHWKKDRGTEPNRTKEDYPWFWGWDGQAEDFMGDSEFDGNRWNDLHYTRAAKLAARERAKAGGKS